MDEEWKKLNQTPEPKPEEDANPAEQNLNNPTTPQQSTPPPTPPANPQRNIATDPVFTPNSQQTRNPGSNWPNQTSPEFNGALPTNQNIQPDYEQRSNSMKNKMIVAVTLVALLIMGAALAYFLPDSGKKSDEQQQSKNASGQSSEKTSITVPADWETIDTKLGFTVKAPANWTDANSLPTNASIGDFISKTITISEPKRDATSLFGNYVAVSTQNLKNSKSQSEFEQGVKDKGKVAEGFGASEDQIKLTSTDVNINGKQWLRVDVQVSSQFFETLLFFWVDDHAIALIVVSDKQTSLDKLVGDYLLPMAASVKLQQ